jgi:hypothetical protein
MKNMTYSDVMAMPTYERRYYLGMLTKDFERKQEQIEEQKEQQTTSGGKGSRTSKVSGQQLKTRMNNGDIPLQ